MEQMSAELLELSAEIRETLDDAQQDTSSIEDVYTKVQTILGGDPALAQRFEAVLQKHLVPLRAEQDEHEEALKGELLFKTDTGRFRLNPFYEAALAERAQFDGDIPEFRTGMLADDIEPAIPVDTTARNPVVIGWMLKLVSEAVREDVLGRQRAAKSNLLGQTTRSDGTALEASRREGVLVQLEFNPEVDPPEYRRGEKPSLMKLGDEAPLGVNTLVLSETEKQQMVWKFLSSTQGRQSAIPLIQTEIAVYLEQAGMTVHASEFAEDADVEILAHHVWSLRISGGGDTQINFAPIDTAAAVLRTSLLTQLNEKFDKLSDMEVWLETIQVSQLSDREVGWAARVVKKGT